MRVAIERRRFLTSCGLVAVGAVGGYWVPRCLETASADDKSGSVEERLKQLKLELPPVVKSTNTLVPAVRVNELLFISGHGPSQADGKALVGKLGQDIDVKQGQAAARNIGLKILSVVRAEIGSLDKVVRLVKTLGMVNATPDFKQQPQVINGFSDLMVEVFGDQAGKGTRSAVGMGSLPGGIPVEIEAIFQVRT